jgi:uncharacterized protein YndB with AHSA1/START domain
MNPAPADDRTLLITRTLDAPRALVWRMFADPYHLAQWWGPKGYTNRVEKLDFRTGGSWLHVMIAPDGKEYPTHSVILDVREPELLSYRNAPGDPKLDGDYLATLGERRQHRAEHLDRHEAAMQQHQRFAAAVDLVIELDIVDRGVAGLRTGGGHGCLLCLSLGREGRFGQCRERRKGGGGADEVTSLHRCLLGMASPSAHRAQERSR